MSHPSAAPLHSAVQQRTDGENLKSLAIAYFVVAGLSLPELIAVGCHYLFVISVMFPQWLATQKGHHSVETAFELLDQFFPWLTAFYLAIGLLILITGVGGLLTGRFLLQRRHRTFCLVVSGLCCLHFPHGAVLGIYSFITLLRPSTGALFHRGQAPLAPVPPTQ